MYKQFVQILIWRLVAWSEQHHLFHANHFGFLLTRDCTLALATFLNNIFNACSNKSFVAVVCFDIKVSYNSVYPEILSYKLASYGTGGKISRWLSEFTHFRLLMIRWKSYRSHLGHWFHGVSQGSVLSPFLFFLYTQDIVECLEIGIYMIVYVDNILLYITVQNEDCARKKLHDTLPRIYIWYQANEISIKPAKCIAINFTRCRNPGVQDAWSRDPMEFSDSDTGNLVLRVLLLLSTLQYAQS